MLLPVSHAHICGQTAEHEDYLRLPSIDMSAPDSLLYQPTTTYSSETALFHNCVVSVFYSITTSPTQSTPPAP